AVRFWSWGSGLFVGVEQPAVLENRVTVGHPGYVVGHGSRAARRSLQRLAPRTGRTMLVGHQAGIREQRVEQLTHDTARLGGHALHLVVLVDPLAQERLQP